MLAFTSDVFLALFEEYNLAIWPAQPVAYALGLLALFLCFRPGAAERVPQSSVDAFPDGKPVSTFPGNAWGGRLIAAILALLWAWNGLAYHWAFFAGINFIAPVFALLFLAQAVLLAWSGVARGRLVFAYRPDAAGYGGLALALYALIVYPLTNLAAGHAWPRMPVFGVAPCPTTIFTFGMLLMAHQGGRTQGPPLHLMAIPIIWALIGATAVWLLDMPEDIALPAAALLAIALLVWQRRAHASRA